VQILLDITPCRRRRPRIIIKFSHSFDKEEEVLSLMVLAKFK